MASTAVKRIEIKAQNQLRSLMRDYFLDLDAAAQDPSRRVAWCPSIGPCEILTAFAHCRSMVRALDEFLGIKVLLPPLPRHAGAYGAALVARELGQSLSTHSYLKHPQSVQP